jgi:hypothetical protein
VAIAVWDWGDKISVPHAMEGAPMNAIEAAPLKAPLDRNLHATA